MLLILTLYGLFLILVKIAMERKNFFPEFDCRFQFDPNNLNRDFKNEGNEKLRSCRQ